MGDREIDKQRAQYEEEAILLGEDQGLTNLLHLLPVPILIVNDQRLVIFANRTIREEFKLSEGVCIYGKRPGELFKCSHVKDSNFKCGTSEWCCYCGISQAVKASMESGKMAARECVVSGVEFTSRSMKALAQPYYYRNHAFTMLVFQDTSEAYRRRLLERVFFHDMQNLVMVMMNSANHKLRHPEETPDDDFPNYVLRVSGRMADEISGQREILDAENNRLKTSPSRLHSHEIIRDVIYYFEKVFTEQDKNIFLEANSVDVIFVSDGRLVRLILVNMVKNALEATTPGAVVRLWSRQENGQVVISVHNPGCMPPEVQLQLFQQTFSTKGCGRGMGTYSMKLLTEKYLDGEVGFVSTPETGTEFFARFPLGALSEN